MIALICHCCRLVDVEDPVIFERNANPQINTLQLLGLHLVFICFAAAFCFSSETLTFVVAFFFTATEDDDEQRRNMASGCPHNNKGSE